MRIVIIFLVLIMATLGNAIPRAEAGVDLGISIGEEGLRGFSLSVGDYYRVPQREVVIIRERGIPYEGCRLSSFSPEGHMLHLE